MIDHACIIIMFSVFTYEGEYTSSIVTIKPTLMQEGNGNNNNNNTHILLPLAMHAPTVVGGAAYIWT